jgi:hypothetical protein
MGGYTLRYLLEKEDDEFLGDVFVLVPLLVVYLVCFAWAVFRDSREYQKTGGIISYLATFTGLFLILLLFSANYLITLKDTTPTILFGALANGTPGLFIDFREDGTFKLGNGSLLGVSYQRGRYILCDSLIVIAETGKSTDLSSRFLVIRACQIGSCNAPFDESAKQRKFIYQLGKNGKVIKETDYFIIREDNRNHPKMGINKTCP